LAAVAFLLISTYAVAQLSEVPPKQSFMEQYFSSPIELWVSNKPLNPLSAYYVLFNPRDMNNSTYEVQVIGLNAGGLPACIKQQAAHLKKDDVKDYTVQAGASIGFDGKQPSGNGKVDVTAHVDVNNAFGREIVRNPLGVFQQIHYRVRVLDAASSEQRYATSWNQSNDFVKQWNWQKVGCSWVTF
jgi:hypothetical protein